MKQTCFENAKTLDNSDMRRSIQPYPKNYHRMKKLLVVLFIMAFSMNTHGQQKDKIRVGLNLGLATPYSGVGFDGDLDIRYNIMDHLNVGMKFGAAALVRDVSGSDNSNYTGTVSAMTSTLFTGDYYFNKPNSSFAKFIGGGLGRYAIGNIQITSSDDQTEASDLSIIPDRKFGGLIRCGFEAGHFRMAMEYYLIPRSRMVDINNNTIGTSGNSFLNFTVGFYLGGGSWKKRVIPMNQIRESLPVQ